MKNSKTEELQEAKKKFDDFSPFWPEKFKKVSNSTKTRKELYSLLKDDIQGSCLWEIMEERSLACESVQQNEAIECPTITDFANDFIQENSEINTEHLQEFSDTVKFSEEQIQKIKNITVQQSGSETWFQHRVGRLTASNFYRVYTRVKNLQKLPSSEIIKASEALVKDLMGYNPRFKPENSHALKYGISTEPEAKAKYKTIMAKKHKKLVTNESGLVIDKENPFLAASPDLEITCQCCGDGLLEIKCPASIKQQQPTSENYKYLGEVTTTEGNTDFLKQNNAYYFQVQGQMGVTGRSYCDFFVYTKVGYHLERIQFNEKLWEEMKEKFYWFWLNILCHELLCHTIKDSAVKDNDSLSAKEVHVHETIKKSMNVTKKRKAQELSTVSQANLKKVKVHETITNSNVTKKRKAQESSTISQANSKKIQIDETTVKRLTNATKKKKQTTKRKAKAQSVYLCGLCKG